MTKTRPNQVTYLHTSERAAPLSLCLWICLSLGTFAEIPLGKERIYPFLFPTEAV